MDGPWRSLIRKVISRKASLTGSFQSLLIFLFSNNALYILKSTQIINLDQLKKEMTSAAVKPSWAACSSFITLADGVKIPQFPRCLIFVIT